MSASAAAQGARSLDSQTLGAWFRSHWNVPSATARKLINATMTTLFCVDPNEVSLLGAMVLAMGLLGPVAAAACGITSAITFSATRWRSASPWLGNICAYSIPPFVGGWLVRAAGDVLNVSKTHTSGQLIFGLALLAALVVLLALNFVLWAYDLHICEGDSIARLARARIW